MSLLTPTGSFINNIMAACTQAEPIVGMGATRLGYTDRKPYTVIEVISPKKIVVRSDNYKRVDKNGLSEMQTYEFSPDENGSTDTLTLRKNGRWVVEGDSLKNGTTFLIGSRDCYHDFCF